MCIRLLLNKCAWTSYDNKNPLLHPIFVSLSNKFAMNEAKKMFEGKYEQMVVQEDYHEIFLKDHRYEITLTFITEEGGTTISVYVHNKKNPYRLKKYLIKFLHPVKEKFRDYISEK